MKIGDVEIGRTVRYDKYGEGYEYGVITSFNSKYVFVRYGEDTGSKATRPQDIEYV